MSFVLSGAGVHAADGDACQYRCCLRTTLLLLLPLRPCLAPDPAAVCSDLELDAVEARLRPGRISLTLVASASFTLPELWTSAGLGRQNGAGGMVVSY
jgi:hypothetical protein